MVGYFARVWRGKERLHQQAPISNSSQPAANAIHLQSPQGDHIQLYNITADMAEPAPTITDQMMSSTRTAPVTVLPDPGADISTARQMIVGILGYHSDNLAPSEISLRAVNGACMKPVGKTPVIISPQGRTYRDDINIFPGAHEKLPKNWV